MTTTSPKDAVGTFCAEQRCSRLAGQRRAGGYHEADSGRAIGATNIDCRFGKLPVKALREADEIFITSTAGGIMPVRSVDGDQVADGAPGPVTTRLKDMYWRLHEDPAYSTPVRYELAQ